MTSDRRLCAHALFFFALGSIPATSSAIAENSATTPADVYARVAETRAEIELIRFEMGRPGHARREIAVSGIAPRGGSEHQRRGGGCGGFIVLRGARSGTY